MTETIAFEMSDALFAAAIAGRHTEHASPILVGLSGSQGSGKSTTALRLQNRLHALGKRTAVCSLDDFYLPQNERQALAKAVHPLLVTRGVPGTHDVALMQETIGELREARSGDRIALPAFDKAADERVLRECWPLWEGRADIILLEGWCIGARPQPAEALRMPVNALEREEDGDGAWRGYVNEQLAGAYAALFATLNLRLMLCAPDFACVHGWRKEQEAGLPRGQPGSRLPMDDSALARFIAHYERITRWLIENQPADVIALLDRDRTPVSWRFKRASAP
jgi:D-glycerate 3-kinase